MTAVARPPTLLIVPLTQRSVPAMREGMCKAVAAGADAVELRLDYLPALTEDDLGTLLAGRSCRAIVTCRAPREGGQGSLQDYQRLALLEQAAELGADWIDIELSTLEAVGSLPGLAGSSLAHLVQLAVGKLIVSAHDFQRRPDNLLALLARLEGSPGAINKLAFASAGPEDALAALELLQASRKPMISLAMGECGVASRILASKYGAFGTFASLDAAGQSAPGQPTIAQLKGLYRWDDITPATNVYGVIGCPIGHSMSPAVHNAAFAADGLNGVYLPFRVNPGQENFDRFLTAATSNDWLHLCGLSVTIPHKENALAYVGGNVDPLSRTIGAINTIAMPRSAGGPLVGRNTDYAAAIDSLAEAMNCGREDMRGRKVSLLGAGGAARAIVAALSHYGADTTIYNRTVLRGERLAAEFSTPAGPVCAAGQDDLIKARAEIIINCTPIGMFPQIDASPLPDEFDLSKVKIVFDTIYNPVRTALLQRAEAAGCLTVTGVEMFVNQAAAQYELWTSRPAPRDVMRESLLRQLSP